MPPASTWAECSQDGDARDGAGRDASGRERGLIAKYACSSLRTAQRERRHRGDALVRAVPLQLRGSERVEAEQGVVLPTQVQWLVNQYLQAAAAR